MRSYLCTLSALLLFFVQTSQAQPPPLNDAQSLASWVAMDAPTGHEHLAINAIRAQYPGWGTDRYGNLIKVIGRGEPRRVVACGLDAYAYAVSQITDDGYLRVHRIGSGSRHPLWDQAHEGQHLRILTRSGPVIAVSAVANGHFASQHADETALISQDDLWLDVGANSAAEVAELGVALLDPVLRDLPPWSFANEVAGPRSGSRISCAATFAAAEAGLNGEQGSTKYVLSVQQVFGWVGLGSALTSDARAQQLIVLGPAEEVARVGKVTELQGRVNTILPDSTRENMYYLAPAAADPDSLMVRVSVDSANQLLASLVELIADDAAVPDWKSAPANVAVLNDDVNRWGQHQQAGRMLEFEQILDELAERSAVPGHEGPIRNFIYDELPAWAKDITQVDELGNMWVEFGPVGEATVFIAHMDEVGYQVESIEADGTVNLLRLGGAVASAWEGQPAVLQLDPNINIDSLPEAPQLQGVFLSRSNPQSKRPDAVQAWFGMNAEQLRAVGVQLGMGVTGYKQGHHMGRFRYASRSLDDRVGTTSLLMAIKNMDPSRLTERVIFAWSVREEGGLIGAGALAKYLSMRTRRVYSIDTFVSSDTPLESPHFAYAPLGEGPVLRSIENSSMATPYELDRNRNIASDADIDVQLGLTQGGTDGTRFTVYSAPNAGLSWPGRYSHSPAEIADMRDVIKLVDLIQAMAEAPQGN